MKTTLLNIAALLALAACRATGPPVQSTPIMWAANEADMQKWATASGMVCSPTTAKDQWDCVPDSTYPKLDDPAVTEQEQNSEKWNNEFKGDS